MEAPADLALRYRALYGSAGDRWIAALPALVESLADEWDLSVGGLAGPLSYSCIARVELHDGSDAILKMAFPEHELRSEIAALKAYDGIGSARLLASDAAAGAILLERLVPGTVLRQVIRESGDSEATRIAARVMSKLWRPMLADSGFPSVADWSHGLARHRARFDGGCGPIPVELLEFAEDMLEQLLVTPQAGSQFLLHGDLHHDNVLYDKQRGWLAIDPKGVVGEREFEAAALLRNPWDGEWVADDPVSVLRNRVEVLTEELRLDSDRLVQWAIVSHVLSAAWSAEEGADGSWSCQCARWMTRLI